MTVHNVVNQLIVHFCEKDTFDMETEAGKIAVDNTLTPHKLPLIVTALEDMERHGLVSQIGDRVWILTKPISDIGQDVGLSIQTCILIADTLTSFFKANNIPHESIDVFNIHEGHIGNLLQVINDTLDKPPHFT